MNSKLTYVGIFLVVMSLVYFIEKFLPDLMAYSGQYEFVLHVTLVAIVAFIAVGVFRFIKKRKRR